MEAMIRDRLKAALWCSLIADALSMPVHWYYNPNDIKTQFGKITTYVVPSEYHPGSIMPQSSTTGGGRSYYSNKNNGALPPVIGGVILKGKEKFWGTKPYHYHCGMKAGQNTLNSLCLRLLIRSINESQNYNADHFLKNYVEFMTAENSHNDVYAESFHRDFFRNWQQGIEPKKCAGEEGHNTAQIGGFVMLTAVILLHYSDRELARQKALEHLRLTHKSPKLESYMNHFVDLLIDSIQFDPSSQPKKEFTYAKTDQIAGSLGFSKFSEKFNSLEDTEFIGRIVSSACYIQDSLPSLLWLIGKYGDSIEECLIANTNVGGENCHRGSAVGSVIGAINGFEQIPKRWVDGLYDRVEIEQEIDSFVELAIRLNKK
jgi:ADP-ribosyl-[dinitrogen reductase] hydrolase